MMEPLRVEIDKNSFVTARRYEPSSSQASYTWVLAHGAGANQVSPFMVEFARGLADRGVCVVTFNFLYTEQRRRTPDSKEVLEACYRRVIQAVREDSSKTPRALLVGGKSLGGRIASYLAAGNDAGTEIRGLICLGYPLHPPGRPERERSAHFQDIRVPSLFVQGSRDTFGAPDELRPRLNQLGTPAQLRIVEGGDHSFSVPKNWPVPQRQVYESIEDDIAAWIGNLEPKVKG